MPRPDPALWPLAAVAAAALAILASVVLFYRRRTSAARREAWRRGHVARHGRVVEALVTDAQGDLLQYAYAVAGVAYHTAQDISALRHRLPSDLTRVVGPATARYLPRDPANSVLLAEGWSGLRADAPQPAPVVYGGES